ncbi:hypothetical protein YC2023_018722 [Brassica napus]
MGICPKTHRSITSSSEFPRNFVKSLYYFLGIHRSFPRNTFFLGISSEYSDGLIFPRNSVGIFRGNSEEIPRISFSVGMSVRIPMFSSSGSARNLPRDTLFFQITKLILRHVVLESTVATVGPFSPVGKVYCMGNVLLCDDFNKKETRAPTQIIKKTGQKENRKAKATKKHEHICLKHRNHNQ